MEIGAPLLPLGDAAARFEVRSLESRTFLSKELGQAIVAGFLPGVFDAILGFDSVTLTFDPEVTDAQDIEANLGQISTSGFATLSPFHHVLEVYFDGEDLEEVAQLVSMSKARLVKEICSARLTVSMLGFSPGFGYLSGLPPFLAAIKRRSVPRLRVEAGTFGIAGGFVGIYPSPSPGGWNCLGHSSVSLFEPTTPPYALLAPGDTVEVKETKVNSRLEKSDRLDRANLAEKGCLVQDGGFYSTVQDLGRKSFGHLGVPAGGPADVVSHQLAQALVGNDPGDASIEIIGRGPVLLFEHATYVACVGSVEIYLDNQLCASTRVFAIRAGQTLSIGALTKGCRAYLTWQGGVGSPMLMESASSDQLAGLGPGPLRRGDSLGVNSTQNVAHLRHLKDSMDRNVQTPCVLRILAGPHETSFRSSGLEQLVSQTFQMTPTSNRVGLRLVPLEASFTPSKGEIGEVSPTAMVFGALQVLSQSSVILLGPDHGTLGGYPVIGVVISADCHLIGQLTPGDKVQFELVDMQSAKKALQLLSASMSKMIVERNEPESTSGF